VSPKQLTRKAKQAARKAFHEKLMEAISEAPSVVNTDPVPKWFRGHKGRTYPLYTRPPDMRILERAGQFNKVLEAYRANKLLFMAALNPDVTTKELVDLRKSVS
jgi:hypothetical protein